MTDTDVLIEKFARIAQEIAIERDQVTDRIMKGFGKKSLSGLNQDEIDFLKRLIEALK